MDLGGYNSTSEKRRRIGKKDSSAQGVNKYYVIKLKIVAKKQNDSKLLVFL